MNKELFILNTKMRMVQDMMLRYKSNNMHRVCPYELCSGTGEEEKYNGLWCIFYRMYSNCDNDNKEGYKKLENMWHKLGRARWKRFGIKY